MTYYAIRRLDTKEWFYEEDDWLEPIAWATFYDSLEAAKVSFIARAMEVGLENLEIVKVMISEIASIKASFND